jgi:DNA gyrase subunit A
LKRDKKDNTENFKENLIQRPLEDIMGDSFGRYSKYIIQDRAIPDVRDGLKPVQRRIMYSMYEEGNRSDKAYRKSAKSVGSIMGNYHPHGDSSIYEAMVRMSQDWKLRNQLIDMHGNNGSIDGDPSAAMRYCLTGDSLVLTDKGLVNIEEIVKNSLNNSDSDIDITVESMYGIKNKSSKFFNSGEHKTRKVTLRNGFNIEGTLNHPLLVITKDLLGKPIFAWELLENVRLGDKIVLSRSTDQVSSNVDLINEDVAGLLGLLVSEGFISGEKQKYKRIGINNKDLTLLDFATSVFENNFKDMYGKISRSENGSTEVISIDSKKLYEHFVTNYDMKLNSYVKVIPKLVLGSTKKIQKEFLKYLFEGDGCVTYNERGSSCVSYTSYSKELIHQLQVLLLTFGVLTSKHTDGNGERLQVTGYQNIKSFYENVGFVSERKTKVLEALLDYYSIDNGMSTKDYVPFVSDYIRNKYKGTKEGNRLNTINFDRYNKFNNRKEELKNLLSDEDFNFVNLWLTKDYIYLDVVDIEDSLDSKVVYSIRVDSECHSFVANGIVNHNTESRLTKLAESLLKDLEKNTVDMVLNFDDTADEPTVLPAAYPNLLANGTTGISAGYATDIPPHNLTELLDACVLLIGNRKASLDEIMEIIKGPDFPGGGIVQGLDEIKKAYQTGRGKIVVRGKVSVEDLKAGKKQLVITEIPYEVNKANLVKKLDLLRYEKKVDGVVEVRDESSSEGVRVVIEMKKEADDSSILNYFYKNTELQVNYNFNMISIYNKTPRLLGVKEMLEAFIDHRVEVVTRRTQNELERANKRHHILEGLIKAVLNLDAVVKIIKASSNKADAKVNLEKKYKFSEMQSEAIVMLQLYRLSSTDVVELEKEKSSLEKLIIELESILKSKVKLNNLIKKELIDIKTEFGTPRRTVIQKEVEELKVNLNVFIPEDDVYISVSKDGYLKRSSFRSVNSSGGESEVGLKEGDSCILLKETKTTNTLLVFTNKGNYSYIPIHTLDDVKWKDTGKHISTYTQLSEGEFIVFADVVEKLDTETYVTIIKDNGLIKRTLLAEHEVQRFGKTYTAIKIKDAEEVVGVWLTTGGSRIVITTELGYGIHFGEDEVAPKGIRTEGMRAIDLREGDKLKYANIVKYKKNVTELEDIIGVVAEYPRGRKGNKVQKAKKKK